VPGDVRRPTALVNRPHIPLDFRRRQSVHAVVERRAEDVVDVEEMIHEASTLLNGVTLLNRMGRMNARESEPETG
jgi:hypothetical protein